MKNIEINDPYGFVYVTTNLINGKRYVGKCCMKTKNPNKWKNYLGSGIQLIRAIKKYGKNNFERTIVSFAYSCEELKEQELKTIIFTNASGDENYYNLYDLPYREYANMNVKYWTNKCGKEHCRYGTHFTEEQKKQMSESAKKKFNSGFIHGKSKPIKIFYNSNSYTFNSIKKAYFFLKEKSLVNICYDTFKQHIREKHIFQNFTYEYIKKDGSL